MCALYGSIIEWYFIGSRFFLSFFVRMTLRPPSRSSLASNSGSGERLSWRVHGTRRTGWLRGWRSHDSEIWILNAVVLSEILQFRGHVRPGTRQVSGEIQPDVPTWSYTLCDLLPRPRGFVFLVTRLIPRNMQLTRSPLMPGEESSPRTFGSLLRMKRDKAGTGFWKYFVVYLCDSSGTKNFRVRLENEVWNIEKYNKVYLKSGLTLLIPAQVCGIFFANEFYQS